MDGQLGQPKIFTFTAGPRPALTLSFSTSPASSTTAPADDRSWRRPKRHRPLTDVDGECSSPKRQKKRRLRLFLITSRLSRPFSAPPTYIVDRGSSKIAVWAKQRHLASDQLRKVAIMNDIRMRVAHAQRAKRWQMEMARQAFIRQPSCSPPRRPYLPRPPSPVASSNYDVLDREDDEEATKYEQGDSDGAIYSDFRILEPTEKSHVVDEEKDAPADLAFPTSPFTDGPPSPPDEKTLDLIRERERQKELCFVRFGDV